LPALELGSLRSPKNYSSTAATAPNDSNAQSLTTTSSNGGSLQQWQQRTLKPSFSSNGRAVIAWIPRTDQQHNPQQPPPPKKKNKRSVSKAQGKSKPPIVTPDVTEEVASLNRCVALVPTPDKCSK